MHKFNKLLILCLSLALISSSFAATSKKTSTKTATFAGGCFWCLEADLEKVPGVIKTVSGFAGGKLKNPTYKQVSSGKTNYMESVQVTYNPKVISYKQLLNEFWHNIDPTDEEGQFCDRGKQYRSAIFYHNSAQKRLALASKKQVKKKIGQADTLILPMKHFYPAEENHQNYAKKNPVKYNFYRYQCQRDQRLKQVWGK